MHWAPTTLTRKPSHSACSATSSKDTPGRTPPRSSRRSTPTSARHASGYRAGVVAATVSADAQEHQTRQWKARAIRDAGEPFLAFYLSYDGYVQLGIEDSLIPTDPYFRAGMKSTPAGARNIVTDPSPQQWDDSFQVGIAPRAAVAGRRPSRRAGVPDGQLRHDARWRVLLRAELVVPGGVVMLRHSACGPGKKDSPPGCGRVPDTREGATDVAH